MQPEPDSPPARSEALRVAERALCARHGVVAAERWLSVGSPATRVRILDIGAGAPVLHVHGGGALGAVHVGLAAALPGRRHLLLDRPGFGLSEHAAVHPDFRGRSVALLSGVLDALGLRAAHLLGHSIGSGMALWFALAHPDRVKGLALAGGVAMLPGPDLPLILRLLAMPVIGPLMLAMERPSPAQVRAFWRRFGHDPDTIEPELHQVVLAAERVPTYATAWRELLQATIDWRGQRPGMILQPAELAAIRCPVAFAWGADDPMVSSEDGRAAARHMPNARFTVVGTGHAPWLVDPQGVARELAHALPTAVARRNRAS